MTSVSCVAVLSLQRCLQEQSGGSDFCCSRCSCSDFRCYVFQSSIVYSVVGCWQKLVNGVHCSSGTHSQFGIDVRHVSGDILYRRLRRLCPAHDRVRVRGESMRCSHQVRLGTTEANEGDRRIRSTCVRPVSLLLLVFLYLFLVIIWPPDIVCRRTYVSPGILSFFLLSFAA